MYLLPTYSINRFKEGGGCPAARVSTEQRASPSLLDEIPWYKTSRNGFLIYYALSSNFWWENPSTEQHERSWLHHTPSSYIAQQYIAVKTQIVVTIFFKSDSPTTIHTYACIIRQIRYCTIIWTKKTRSCYPKLSTLFLGRRPMHY